MKHIHSHISLLVFAASVLIAVAAAYAYMRHAVSGSIDRAILARDIAAVEDANKQHERGLAQLYASTAPDRARLGDFFVSSDTAVSFIETLESIGTKSGSKMTLSSINADNLDGAKPGTLGHISAHVEAQGTWASIMRALGLAEALPYSVSLDRVRLDVSALGADRVPSRVWRLSFDITASLLAASSTRHVQ